jgi:protein TonB
MAYIRANLFYEREPWQKSVAVAAGLHVLLAVVVVVLGFVLQPRSGSNWGANEGEAVSAQLVTAASIPIPHPEEAKNNIVATENKGVTQTVPQPKPVETEDGISIQGKVIPHKIEKAVTPPNIKPHPVPTPEDTAVPYGEGGPVSGPFGNFSASNTKGGFSMQNADFGSRFAYYVQAVNQKVSSNWYKVEVDPRVTSAKRVYLVFDIQKDGTPSNVRIEQSSGIPSLDQSAVRALQRIDTFGPLPREYTGSKVSVEFWFDYQR